MKIILLCAVVLLATLQAARTQCIQGGQGLYLTVPAPPGSSACPTCLNLYPLACALATGQVSPDDVDALTSAVICPPPPPEEPPAEEPPAEEPPAEEPPAEEPPAEEPPAEEPPAEEPPAEEPPAEEPPAEEPPAEEPPAPAPEYPPPYVTPGGATITIEIKT